MSKARDIASAAPAPAGVTSTELGYVDGVTSAIQTQINSKIGQSTAINPTIVDAKGDIITATADNTPARLAVGTNGQVLKADSSAATGLAWGSAAVNASYSLLNTGGTALTGASTITVSGISGMNSIMVLVNGVTCTGASETINFILNGDNGSNYTCLGSVMTYATAYAAANLARIGSFDGAAYYVMRTSTSTTSDGDAAITITGANNSGIKIISGIGAAEARTGNGAKTYISQGYYKGTSTISSVAIKASTNFTGGTIYVYGAA